MSNSSVNTFQKGLGIPCPGCIPVLAAERQGLLWAAAEAGIEQKQMCARCSGREVLAEAQNAALGTGSWKSVSLDRLLLVSRSNTVYFEVLGVQPQALPLPWLGGGGTGGVTPRGVVSSTAEAVPAPGLTASAPGQSRPRAA